MLQDSRHWWVVFIFTRKDEINKGTTAASHPTQPKLHSVSPAFLEKAFLNQVYGFLNMHTILEVQFIPRCNILLLRWEGRTTREQRVWRCEV